VATPNPFNDFVDINVTAVAVVEEAEPDTRADEEFEAFVGSLINDCEDFIDEEISPRRALATEYYKGDLFGDEMDGRSQVVSRDVRDTVNAMLPSLMRVFFSADNMVEYAPNGPEDIPFAKQATDYARYVVEADNDGFSVFTAAFKDALVRKSGILKWYWDDSVSVSSAEYTGLGDNELTALYDEEGVEVEMLAQYDDPEAERVAPIEPTIDPASGLPIPVEIPQLYDVRVTRKTPANRIAICAVPPEEFIIDRRARTIDDAQLVGHRSMKTVSELVAMGYDPEMVESYASVGNELDDNDEFLARTDQYGTDYSDIVKRVLYIESWVRYDYDGDGIAELRRVCTMGGAYNVVMNEPADEAPFAVLCPDPEPHLFFGYSVAEAVMDIQKIKSHLMRGMLDSLAQSINPRTAVVDGQVNIDDVLNNEVGAIIRQRAPGMVTPFETNFLGASAMPVLAYMDEVKENRTGISKAAAGLDADALQSSTKAAVSATLSASQQQIEMIARHFAAGLKHLYKGLLGLMKKHQNRSRVIRLRNEWVPVDPSLWPADMDVVINVGFGRGNDDERMMFLSQIAAKQEAILAQVGLDNPLVGVQEYRNTLAKMVNMAGFKNSEEFFKDPAKAPPAPPAPPEPPPPDPALILAQAQAKAEADKILLQQQELELKKMEAAAKDDLEHDKLDVEVMLRAKELELKYNAQVNTAEIKAMMERDRTAMNAINQQQMAAIQAQMQAQAQPQMPPMPPEGMNGQF
jgi:hypothetical protein